MVMVVKKKKKKVHSHGGHADTQIKLYGKIVKYSHFWKCGLTHDILERNISTGKMKIGNNLYSRSWTWCKTRLLDCCGAFKTSLWLLSNCKWQRCLFISVESSKVIRTASYTLSTCSNDSDDLLETVAKELKFKIKKALPRLLNYLVLFFLALSFGTYWKRRKKKQFVMERTSNSCANMLIIQ